jgi:predicted HicB family RNase H-like nuclease
MNYRVVFFMSGKFVITPKSTTQNEKSVTFTIRIDRELQEKYDSLALSSNRSRNELINMALKYALQNLQFVDNATESSENKT